jgi:type IV secretory pathway VirJ component
VVISGDGGWRDLDKTIAETLQKQGVSVVGVDSLRYFWTPKSPEQTSHDLARILDRYSTRWHARHFALIGYSFGADVMPFAYNRLPDALREKVSYMSLLGFAHAADFQIRVSGWLGLPPSEKALNVAPEIARVPASRVQCIYGEDEDDTLCPSLAASGVAVVRTAGGHHFSKDYVALTKTILDGWKAQPDVR